MGERQVATDISEIRADHVNRYLWARDYLSGDVTDIACGVGYGSKLLADSGLNVKAIDISSDAIQYARTHYNHKNIDYRVMDMYDVTGSNCVAFECIEHIERPFEMLKNLTGLLLASVPNEDVFPYRNYKYHFRHYTKGEFEELLSRSGFQVLEWFGQEGIESEVEKDLNGRTLIAVAEK